MTAGGSEGTEPTWLTEVRLRIARRVLWLRALWAANCHPGDEAVAIGHGEVDRTLQPAVRLTAAEQRFYREDAQAAGLTDAIDRLADAPLDPRWDHLVTSLGLTPQEANLLALALAVHAVPGMRRVFGYLQDGTAPADASIGLAAALWGWPPASLAGTASALTRWELARPRPADPYPYSDSSEWVADPLILAQLTGAGPPGGYGLTGHDIEPTGKPVLYPAELDEIVGFTGALLASGLICPCIEIELAGAAGSGKTVLAAQATAKLGEHLVSVDAATLAARPDPGPAAVRELRQARLNGSVLVWQHADLLPEPAVAAINVLARLAFLETGAETALPASPGQVRYRCTLPPMDRHTRLRLWSAMSDNPAPAAVTDWPLSPGEVATAARVLPAGEKSVGATLRRSIMHPAPGLLQPVPLPYTWPDLVLAPHVEQHLRELEGRARLRGDVLDEWGFADLTAMSRGLTALFAGPSGCGKTMAAQVSRGHSGWICTVPTWPAWSANTSEKRKSTSARSSVPASGHPYCCSSMRPTRYSARERRSETRTTGSPTSRLTTSCNAWRSSMGWRSSRPTARRTLTRPLSGGSGSSSTSSRRAQQNGRGCGAKC